MIMKFLLILKKLVGSSGGTINGNTRNGMGNEIPPDPFDIPGINPVDEFTLGSPNMNLTKSDRKMSSSSGQPDFFITNGGITPISPKPRNSLNSTNSFTGSKAHSQTQSINSYSTIPTPSLNVIPSLPPPNSSKAGTLSSTSTTSSISSSLFNSIATSSRMSQQNFDYSNTANTTRPLSSNASSLDNIYSSNTNTTNTTSFNPQFNSMSPLPSKNNNTLNLNKNMNTIPSQPIFNTGSILQPISSSNKSGLNNNNNSGTNQKISKGDLTMFDPYS